MKTKYGLPEQVLFCKRCVISNQRPNSVVEYNHDSESIKKTIHFDEGICDACRVAEAKAQTDWQARRRELEKLCDAHRKQRGYDCIVPGSGGKDSFFAAHVLKHEFGMHPLTVTWAPHIHTEWGRRNFDRWVEEQDNYLCTPSRQTHRLLTRLAVENLFHPFQPFVIGQKSLAPKMARIFGVPLVFYGENEAEYGNPKDDAASATRSDAYFTCSDRRVASSDIRLSGMRLDDLHNEHGLSLSDLEPYLPLADASGIEVHYLGYYLKWKPQECYYYAVEHGGFEPSPERTPGTYSKYNSIDDKIDDFHYWTTYQKFGIGRATYDASQEIRSGDITREEGIALVRRFDGEWPARFVDEINEYLSVPGFPRMTVERWWSLAEKFRSPHLWHLGRLSKTIFDMDAK